MVQRQTSGNNRQLREKARDARARGKSASKAGATTGASQQRKKVRKDASHEERLAGKNKSKVASTARDRNESRPRSRS
jgi:hypothetical protein